MRERKRALTHGMRVYKFRCYLRSDPAAPTPQGMLPDAIYAFAERQQKLWNALATEQQNRWNAWKQAHPPSLGKDGKPKFVKLDKAYWESSASTAIRQRCRSKSS